MATHASRDTSDGLLFEKQYRIDRTDGINLSKKKLCSYFKNQFFINPLDYLSWSFEPDEAYIVDNMTHLVIYEKKKQSTGGSADEKLASCDWKLKEYTKLAQAAGIEKVSYIYILCTYFKKEKYSKMLEYIKSVGCDYIFSDEIVYGK